MIKRNTNPDKTPMQCPICGRFFNGPRSLKSHNTQVHVNIGRDNSKRGSPKGRPAWNKGLTKETDERVLKNSESVSKTIQSKILDGTYTPSRMGKEAREKLSERQSLQNSGGRSKWFEVNGVKVQGTWERDVAIKLNEMCVEWVKPKTNKFIFKYEMDGKIRSYSPDFYLPEFDVYLEIKGYWWGRDREKMDLVASQYPDKRIVIVEKREFELIVGGEQVW